MMLELVKVLLLAVLCSSTQGMYIIHTKNKPSNTASSFFQIGRLVQVSGYEATCSDDIVFWCTSEFGILIWEISTTTGVYSAFSTYNSIVRLNLTPDSSLVAQVTFNNGSFINATVTIMRPINLNGAMIRCNQDILTLNIPANTGKFLGTGIGNK